MRGRRVLGPTRAPLAGSAGRGGPALPPVVPIKPNPGLHDIPAPQWPSAAGLTKVIGQGVGEWVDAFQVGAGLLLMAVGLLLATGVLGASGRTGFRLARTGARLLR